jgi:hypothetical protein
MSALRIVVITIGLVTLALPVAATAVPPDPASRPMPVAIAQPLAAMNAPLRPATASAALPETGLLVLVGAGLMGLATIVRRATKT